jgi:hypothetical protein
MLNDYFVGDKRIVLDRELSIQLTICNIRVGYVQRRSQVSISFVDTTNFQVEHDYLF